MKIRYKIGRLLAITAEAVGDTIEFNNYTKRALGIVFCMCFLGIVYPEFLERPFPIPETMDYIGFFTVVIAGGVVWEIGAASYETFTRPLIKLTSYIYNKWFKLPEEEEEECVT